MNKLSPRLLCQIFVLLVLLATTIMSALPYLVLALALLLAMLFITLCPVPPRLKMVITVAIFFLVPLILTPLLDYLTLLPPIAVPIIATISLLPVIYLLDYDLKQNAQTIGTFAIGKTVVRMQKLNSIPLKKHQEKQDK